MEGHVLSAPEAQARECLVGGAARERSGAGTARRDAGQRETPGRFRCRGLSPRTMGGQGCYDARLGLEPLAHMMPRGAFGHANR